MENEDKIIISRYAFERMQTKEEKNNRWKNIFILVLIILLVVTNAMWLVAWNQYEYVDDYSIDLSADDGSDANYIGNDGDINYGGEDNSTENEIENTP